MRVFNLVHNCVHRFIMTLKCISYNIGRHSPVFVQSRNESDESQAVASVLATYLKHVGYTEVKNHPMLASCPTFNTKDKKAFWLKAKQVR